MKSRNSNSFIAYTELMHLSLAAAIGLLTTSMALALHGERSTPASHGDDAFLVGAEKYLAIQLVPNHTDPVSHSIVTIYQGKVHSIRHLSRRDFILIATGAMQSPFNPESKNLLALQGIDRCGYRIDSVSQKVRTDCQCIDDLWRLRYNKHPLTNNGEGWSRGEGMPDASQMAMLQPFGIQKMHDLIYGDPLFALLRAVNDPQWVASYR